MATKKSERTAVKQNRQDHPTIAVRIDRMMDREDSKVKAYASANIGGVFAVHGIRVVDSQKGLFVQMPQRIYQRNGRTAYEDIFHPVTADSRQELYGAVLSAYEQRLHMEEDEAQEFDETEEEDPAFEQSM